MESTMKSDPVVENAERTADMRASALVSCGGSMWDGDGDGDDIGGDIGDDDDTASEPSQRRCVSQTRLKFTRAESTSKSKSRLSGDAIMIDYYTTHVYAYISDPM